MTYLITISCYGARLHGDPRGSVDRNHNQPGSPACADEPLRVRFERAEMIQAPYRLDEARRAVVLFAIRSVCEYRRWELFAAHIRQSHLHVVTDVSCVATQAAQDFKEYASRFLNRASLDSPGRKRWARHSSARLLPNQRARMAAIHYVVANQGEPMALWVPGESTP
jgi:hypothetical protein